MCYFECSNHSFELWDTGNEHTFEHYQYKGWPKDDVPATSSTVISLIRKLFKTLETKKGAVKILVHGSTGVGRTGTFIALFELMEIFDSRLCEYKQLESSAHNKTDNAEKLDIFNSVFNLRKQRCEMVRNIQKTYKLINLTFFISLL